ncbi:MAG: type II secretion system GspH family protein [Puniceicoccales bacterium]|jgi:hypothetical protein|nr:type II secretion system GspH family protein [Puniceicoccales bacterium]
MKRAKHSAFMMLEVITAMAIFAMALPIVLRIFVDIFPKDPIDEKAIAMVVDLENCIENIDHIPTGGTKSVHCLLSETDETFSVKKERISLPGSLAGQSGGLEMYEITISNHPSRPSVPLSFRIFTYNP